MEDLKETIYQLNIMDKGKVLPINVDGSDGFLVRGVSTFAVAFRYDFVEEINELFIGINLKTSYLNLNNETIRILTLEAEDNVDLDKFSTIAENFLNKNHRKQISERPYKWVDEWTHIFGNALRNKEVYSILGELVTLKYFYEQDKSVVWEGPNSGTHDIVGNSFVCEVKSSTQKANTNVHINSAYQITNEKKEILIFCRMELKPFGISINSIVDDLVALGYSRDELDKCLQKLGITKASRLRKVEYEILEMRSYDVTYETFPNVSLEKINMFAPKKNIISFTYEIDLSSILFKKIK